MLQLAREGDRGAQVHPKICILDQFRRDQWRAKRRCPGHDHEELHAQFRLWLKRPQVKTRKELRREAFDEAANLPFVDDESGLKANGEKQ